MKNPLLYPHDTMHIHPSSPNSSISEESAATKIQANFRGYRVRKQMKDAAGNDDMIDRTENENGLAEVASVDLEASAAQRISGEENKSATKIQAGVRGFLVRKKQKIASEAAVKIQSSFRGFKARQEIKKLKDKWFAVVAAVGGAINSFECANFGKLLYMQNFER